MRTWSMVVGLALSFIASCGDDDAAAPCASTSECERGEVCLEGRCRAVTVRDVGIANDAPPSGDAGPTADAREPDDAQTSDDARVEPDAHLEDARVEMDARPDDARVEMDARVDDARLEMDARSDEDARADDGRVDVDARADEDAGAELDASTDASGTGDADATDSGTAGCSHSDECPPGSYCELPSCDAPGVCVVVPPCADAAIAPVCACDGPDHHDTFRNACEARERGFGGIAAGLCGCTLDGDCESGWCNLGFATMCADSANGYCERRPVACDAELALPTCGCPGGRAFPNDCERRMSGVPGAQACGCTADPSGDSCCRANVECVEDGSGARCIGVSSCSGPGTGRCVPDADHTMGQCWDDTDCPTPGMSCTGAVTCRCDETCTPATGTCAYRSTLFRP